MQTQTPQRETRTRPVRRVSFEALRGFSDLFRAYAAGDPALDAFYAGDFRSEEARAGAARRAADRDREALTRVLEEQNARLSPEGATPPPTQSHIEALRDPEGVAVVTGQQVGLMTGPLYTIYKTITALQLTRRLKEETGRPVAPVFWLEGEDHDFDEVARLRLLRRNEQVEARLPEPSYEGMNGGPVGRHTATDELEAVLETIDATLPDSDFKPSLMEKVRAAYQPSVPLLEAFARLMQALFPEAGLVFINPNDRRLKALAAPLFQREIEEPGASSRQVQEAGRQLEDQGFHAQVQARPTNLFLLTDDGRLPLDVEDDAFVLRGTDRSFSKEEMVAHLEEHPERFSPNVVLRPLMQDLLLPTAAYVAGPGEVAYFAQLRDVYEWAGVEMPVIYPRASATLVESKVRKVLEKFDLGVPAVTGNLEALFQQVVTGVMDTDVDAVFGEALPPIHEALNALKPQVEAVDESLGPAVEAARATIAGALDDLKAKVVRAEKRDRDEVKGQLKKAQANLFPDGELQERTLNVLYFLNKYSPALLSELREILSLDTTEHQVVAL